MSSGAEWFRESLCSSRTGTSREGSPPGTNCGVRLSSRSRCLSISRSQYAEDRWSSLVMHALYVAYARDPAHRRAKLFQLFLVADVDGHFNLSRIGILAEIGPGF